MCDSTATATLLTVDLGIYGEWKPAVGLTPPLGPQLFAVLTHGDVI